MMLMLKVIPFSKQRHESFSFFKSLLDLKVYIKREGLYALVNIHQDNQETLQYDWLALANFPIPWYASRFKNSDVLIDLCSLHS